MMNRIRAALKREFHSIIVVSVFLVFIAVTVFLVYYFGLNEYFTSQEKMQEYISGFGVAAPVIFMVIQIVQVIISPIPGNVTTLAGGALFGFWDAFWISSIAITVGSTIAFLIARVFGRRIVVWMVGADRVIKYLDVFVGKQRHMLPIMFLLPFFPDDILCYIAGISKINFTYFIILTILTRPWGLLVSALIGSGVLSFTWHGWTLIGIGIVISMFISIKYGRRIKIYIIQIFRKRRKHNEHI